MNKTRKALVYLFLDFVLSSCAWFVFFVMRRFVFENSAETSDHKAFEQIVPAMIIGTYWVFLYGLGGLYVDPYRKSRLREFFQILKFTLFGVILIFFLVFLDDLRPNTISYQFYGYYFLIQFLIIASIHFLLSTITNIRIRKRKIGFPTLIIGSGDQARKIWKEIDSARKSLGFKVIGYVPIPEAESNHFYGKLKRLGVLPQLREVIQKRKIEEVIIALDRENKEMLLEIVQLLEGTSAKVKIVPGIYDYILGSVKTTHILGSPLVEIFPDILSTSEKFAKRAMDVAVSTTFLVLFSPLYLMLAIAVKGNSRGPVFFRQERIGKGGAPFKIIKFRTMVVDAEKLSGPALSSDNDPRITKVGRFLRKSRLDEIPQFWNVLKGDMSLVGPRPERQFFIDQIVVKAPHYRHLQRVKPGITSWGQVKFGYAENVDEMIERLTFDILYIENISLLLDIKIILYTVIVMIEGRGK